jgi:hypothetical protein
MSISRSNDRIDSLLVSSAVNRGFDPWCGQTKDYNLNSNMPSFFRFVNERASYPFGIISLAHAPVNVTDFTIGSINCNPNNADRGRSIIRVS